MNVAIFGQSGTGKSTFAASLFAQMIDEYDRALILTDNFDDIDRVSKLIEDMEIAHVEVTAKNIDKIDFAKLVRMNESILAIETVNLVADEIEEMMDELCDAVYTQGNYLVYIDEAHLFLPRLKCSIAAERLWRGGRKHAITNIAVTQQLRDLRDVVMKQAHYMIIFKMTQHNELEMLKAYVDVDLIKELDDYECIVLDRLRGKYVVSKSDLIVL